MCFCLCYHFKSIVNSLGDVGTVSYPSHTYPRLVSQRQVTSMMYISILSESEFVSEAINDLLDGLN